MNIWLESFVCFMVFPVNSNFVGKFFLLMVYSESLSNPNFHWVLNRAQHHMDMLTTDKKNLVLWGKRLHIAIQVSLIYFFIALREKCEHDIRIYGVWPGCLWHSVHLT